MNPSLASKLLRSSHVDPNPFLILSAHQRHVGSHTQERPSPRGLVRPQFGSHHDPVAKAGNLAPTSCLQPRHTLGPAHSGDEHLREMPRISTRIHKASSNLKRGLPRQEEVLGFDKQSCYKRS